MTGFVGNMSHNKLCTLRHRSSGHHVVSFAYILSMVWVAVAHHHHQLSRHDNCLFLV
jgi:hypothetical protein